MPQPEKKLVNSNPPMLNWCILLPHWEGGLEVDLTLTLPQLRHIDQAAEALLDAAPLREELIRPIRVLRKHTKNCKTLGN